MSKRIQGRLLGVAGILGSGKSTFSNILCSTGYWERIRFAEDLKRITSLICLRAGYPSDMVQEMVDGCLKAVWNPELQMTPRRFQQLIGTEYRLPIEEFIRNNPSTNIKLVQNNLWLTSVQGRVHYLRSVVGKNVVIDDLRFFDTEGKWIKSEGGQCVLIKTDREPVQVDMNTYRMIDKLTAREPNNFFRRNRRDIIIECIAEVMSEERQPANVREFYRSETAKDFSRLFFDGVLLKEFKEGKVEIQAPSLTHASEVSISDAQVDAIIWNNGSLQNLKDLAMQFLALSDAEAIQERMRNG